jgi:hypothetical protein
VSDGTTVIIAGTVSTDAGLNVIRVEAQGVFGKGSGLGAAPDEMSGIVSICV